MAAKQLDMNLFVIGGHLAFVCDVIAEGAHLKISDENKKFLARAMGEVLLHLRDGERIRSENEASALASSCIGLCAMQTKENFMAAMDGKVPKEVRIGVLEKAV